MGAASGGTSGQIEPRRAAVVPRVCAWPEGEALSVELQIGSLLKQGARGRVNIFGRAGAGKTTALAHLAAVFGEAVVVVEGVPAPEARGVVRERLLVYATPEYLGPGPGFQMAPWGEDDCIEYLVHRHRAACASVMGRLRVCEGKGELEGVAELWVIVLEEFARDEELMTIGEALRRYARRELGSDARYEAFARSCFIPRGVAGALKELVFGVPKNLGRLPAVARHVGAECMARSLFDGGKVLELTRHFPMMQEAARLLRGSAEARDVLQESIELNRETQATAVSLMLEVDPKWRPTGVSRLRLADAHLEKADWVGVDLAQSVLQGAYLGGATLEAAMLDGASLVGADLRRANLTRARLNEADLTRVDAPRVVLKDVVGEHVQLEAANLEGAVLEGAALPRARMQGTRLSGADCRGAIFRGAVFERARVDGANFGGSDFFEAVFQGVRFRDAVWDGATFCRARLVNCELEGVEMPGVDFSGADLLGSYLTGSVMPGAKFYMAKLRQTGLADVNWEGADLRYADFRGASFHLGSTRSGLVHSELASEGTRTGFYTDDFSDQDFRPPEEIRKANLCGCDFSGAIVTLTDFYLVDLRGAKYSEEQRVHFERCGAILKNRV